MDGRTDGRMDGQTENIYSIFRDKLLLLGEHVYHYGVGSNFITGAPPEFEDLLTLRLCMKPKIQ